MYTPDEKMFDRLKNDHSYHAPKPELNQAPRYEQIRGQALIFALYLLTVTPPSREQSLALSALEEVVFYANAAIARNE